MAVPGPISQLLFPLEKGVLSFGLCQLQVPQPGSSTWSSPGKVRRVQVLPSIRKCLGIWGGDGAGV